MQGKRKDQIEFSTRAVMISIIGISVLLITMLFINTDSKPTDPNESPYNYWLPSDTLRDSVTRGVSIDPIQSDEYRMWITGNGDTIWE